MFYRIIGKVFLFICMQEFHVRKYEKFIVWLKYLKAIFYLSLHSSRFQIILAWCSEILWKGRF